MRGLMTPSPFRILVRTDTVCGRAWVDYHGKNYICAYTDSDGRSFSAYTVDIFHGMVEEHEAAYVPAKTLGVEPYLRYVGAYPAVPSVTVHLIASPSDSLTGDIGIEPSDVEKGVHWLQALNSPSYALDQYRRYAPPLIGLSMGDVFYDYPCVVDRVVVRWPYGVTTDGRYIGAVVQLSFVATPQRYQIFNFSTKTS